MCPKQGAKKLEKKKKKHQNAEHMQQLNNSVRPFLSHFWAQLGDTQPSIFVSYQYFLGGPFYVILYNFQSCTLQQYSGLCSRQNFHLHNLAQRCLFSLQLSNFLSNDFASLIIRKTHQHQRHLTAIVDITQPIKTHEICNQ